MRRSIIPGISAAALALVLGAVPNVSLAAQPVREHVIVANHADAVFTTQDGCILTQVFISSMDAMFSGSPAGPVNKQGLTGVGVIRSDTCQEPQGKGYPRVFDGLGQTLQPLVAGSAPAQSASLQAVIPVTDDISGVTHEITLDLTWAAVTPAQHDTTRSHVREPRGAIVNSAANTWMADAVAFGSVTLDGDTLVAGETYEAHLSRTKQNCLVVQHPQGGADFDCS